VVRLACEAGAREELRVILAKDIPELCVKGRLLALELRTNLSINLASWLVSWALLMISCIGFEVLSLRELCPRCRGQTQRPE
jgi:hypothetical protein